MKNIPPLTIEISMDIEYDLSNSFKFINEVFVDVYNYQGLAYGSHILEYTKDINEYFNLKFNTGIYWGNKKFYEVNYELNQKLRISHLQFLMELSYFSMDKVVFVPFLDYCFLFDKEFKSLLSETLINTGIKIQLEF